MRTVGPIKKLIFVLECFAAVFCFTLNSCSTFQLSLKPHAGPVNSVAKSVTVEEESCDCEEKIASCEECKVIPQSGMLRDLRQGYYYDAKEKKCKHVSYSSGGVPAPFKTMEECKSCCCNSWR